MQGSPFPKHTKFPCPRCGEGALIVEVDHIRCSSCDRRFKLPVLPREIEVDQKVASLTFDFGDGTEDTRDIIVKRRINLVSEEHV